VKQAHIGFGILTALISLTPGFAEPPTPPPPAPSWLQYDQTVKPELKTAIERDMETLSTIQVNYKDPEFLKLFGFSHEPTAAMLEAWLKERFKVVMQDFDWDSQVLPLNPIAEFPDSLEVPFHETLLVDESATEATPEGLTAETAPAETAPSPTPAANSGPVMIMANLGSAFYLTGRMHSSLSMLFLPGLPPLPVTSARIGVIQIGEGLFLPRFQPNPENPGSLSNSLFRLFTYFHEARHSDGNRKTLAFGHALCPEGHDYAKSHACDRNANGPYSVEANLGRALTNTYVKDMPRAEWNMLRMYYLDAFNRVITFQVDQEKLLKIEREVRNIVMSGAFSPKTPEEAAADKIKIAALSKEHDAMFNFEHATLGTITYLNDQPESIECTIHPAFIDDLMSKKPDLVIPPQCTLLKFE